MSGTQRLQLNRQLSEAVSEVRHPGQKLTPETVVEIRERYAAGEHNKAALGREFGVSTSAICDVVYGNSWKHVGGPTKRGESDGE